MHLAFESILFCSAIGSGLLAASKRINYVSCVWANGSRFVREINERAMASANENKFSSSSSAEVTR